MSAIGAMIAATLAASGLPVVEEVDPDPAWFEAPCPACAQLVWWQSVGRDKGRAFTHEIHCACTEAAR